MLRADSHHLEQPVLSVARRDVATLRQDFTVQQALDAIRERGLGESIVYFYVVDTEQHLLGVLPTRRLLTAPLAQPLRELMIAKVVAIPQQATVFDACELFVMHKFLAFPVVDQERRVVGVVDVNLFTEEVLNLAERERLNAVFESIGFHVAQVRDVSPARAFRYRFPWLLATIGSGLLCAGLAGAFEGTLARSLLLAFFLTLVLGLGESVSMQSMTVTIQALRSRHPSWGWYGHTLRRELGAAVLLGGACGLLVGAIVWAWHQTSLPALAIGSSIALALTAACFFGLSVPALVHALKLDPRIAAGPLTLACTDLSTLVCYFGVAAWLL